MNNNIPPHPKRHMIALYYCYPPTGLPTDQLTSHAHFHEETCTELNLGGRIRVSEEGINGVLSGTEDSLMEYDFRLRNELMQLVLVSRSSDGETISCNCSSSSSSSSSNNNSNKEPTSDWLDIKYCHLRNDIPIEEQLFDTLSVKITREVVSLIEPTENLKKNKGKRCRQRRKQKRKEKQLIEKLHQLEEEKGLQNHEVETIRHNESSNTTMLAATEPVNIKDWKNSIPAEHLLPEEWNKKLLDLANQKEEGEAVLLDTRNIYESRVGHFAVPNLATFFPNTRKFSSLPMVLNTVEAADALSGKQVFMYCTGGVRCERAGTYLRALSDSNCGAWQGKDKPKAIFQLKGGIQKYLETYGKSLEQTSELINDETDEKMCLYRGKNFVFDPRRTDPVIGNGIVRKDSSGSADRVSTVGQCIICNNSHDDYDNGFSPCDEKEARCCRCRVLVLVCNECRPKMRSCGEPETADVTDLLCGGDKCIDEGNVAENVEIIRF